MVDEFYLDPQGLARATGDLRSSGKDLSEAYVALSAVLAHNDQCWGTDDIGKGFANKYVKSAGEICQGGDISAKNMISTADVTDQNSTNFQGLDEDSAETLDRTPPTD